VILTLIISSLAYRQFLAVDRALEIRFPPPSAATGEGK